MANDFRSGALSKLADQLSNLKQKNLRIRVILEHCLVLARSKFKWPSRNLGHATTFGGIHGVLAEDIPANSAFYQTGGTPKAPRAGNIFHCYSQLKQDDSIEEDFWSIADRAGLIVLDMRPCLKRDTELWTLWETLDPQCLSSNGIGRDVWLDFVFEVAWLQVPGLPLRATKRVYWNGMAVELIDDKSATRETFRWLQDCMEKDGEIGRQEDALGAMAQWLGVDRDTSNKDNPGFVAGGDPIPEPFPAWDSSIGDIVGASQHAIDFLLARIADEGESQPTDHKQKTGVGAYENQRLSIGNGREQVHPWCEFWEHLIETLEFFERVVQPVDSKPKVRFESQIGRRFSDEKFHRIHRRDYHYRKPTDDVGFEAVERFLNVDQVGKHETLFTAAYSVSLENGSANDICKILNASKTAFSELLPMRSVMKWDPDEALELWQVWRRLEKMASEIELRLPSSGSKVEALELRPDGGGKGANPTTSIAVKRPQGTRPTSSNVATEKIKPWHDWEGAIWRFIDGRTPGKCWSDNAIKTELIRAGVEDKKEFNNIHKRTKKRLDLDKKT